MSLCLACGQLKMHRFFVHIDDDVCRSCADAGRCYASSCSPNRWSLATPSSPSHTLASIVDAYNHIHDEQSSPSSPISSPVSSPDNGWGWKWQYDRDVVPLAGVLVDDDDDDDSYQCTPRNIVRVVADATCQRLPLYCLCRSEQYADMHYGARTPPSDERRRSVTV